MGQERVCRGPESIWQFMCRMDSVVYAPSTPNANGKSSDSHTASVRGGRRRRTSSWAGLPVLPPRKGGDHEARPDAPWTQRQTRRRSSLQEARERNRKGGAEARILEKQSIATWYAKNPYRAPPGWNSKIPGRYSNHGSQKFFETGLGSQTQFKNNIAS